MSDAVAIALITACGVVVAAAIAALPLLLSIRKAAKSGARDAAVARNQVENDHKTNMREEGDERHEQNAQAAAEMLRLQRANARRLGGIDRRMKRVEYRLDIVEDTIPRPPRRNK